MQELKTTEKSIEKLKKQILFVKKKKLSQTPFKTEESRHLFIESCKKAIVKYKKRASELRAQQEKQRFINFKN